MKSVLLICGHKNIENIGALGLRKWRSYTTLRKSTGATGERDWIWEQLMPKLKDKLIASGIQVFITDAIYHDETYNRDYDLCLALHFDGGGDDSRCIISSPRSTIIPPFITKDASLLADQFVATWVQTYPQITGITSRQDRITPSMTDYYCWDYVKEGTPAVIVEHGNVTCPSDYHTMFEETDKVVDGDFQSILKFLAPQPQEPDTNGQDVAIGAYKDWISDIIEVSRPPEDKKDLAGLKGWIQTLKSKADSYDGLETRFKNFVNEVGRAVSSASTDEKAVLEALTGFTALKIGEVAEIKKKKLMEFSKKDLLWGLVLKFLTRR